MTFATYDIWRYIHVLLFVYWLGADLGVYYAAKYVARADLPLDERLRFLDLTLLLDMGPRTVNRASPPEQCGFYLPPNTGDASYAECL